MSKHFTTKALYLLVTLFTFYTVWIVLLHTPLISPDSYLFDLFTDTYGVIAAVGGIIGLIISFKWGGVNSIVGRSIFLFSLGLIFHFLGQISFAAYRAIYQVDVPYPSFGEIFYFGSIPIYIYATWLIGEAAGVKYKLKVFKYQLISAMVVLGMVGASYYLFISQYDFSEYDWVLIFLEIGYPVGQAIYVSLAILALLLSKSLLGGVMRDKVVLVLWALIIQYIADTHFTYEALNETLYAGGLNDYLYIISYFIMAVALYKFKKLPEQLSERSIAARKENYHE